MDRGVAGTGAGFDAKSMGRLGGRGPLPIHNPDPRKLREVAVMGPPPPPRAPFLMLVAIPVLAPLSSHSHLRYSHAAVAACSAHRLWAASGTWT